MLISTYVCHPSLANDNLSGHRGRGDAGEGDSRSGDLRHSYRFLFAPGTIGPLAWLHENRERARPDRGTVSPSPASAMGEGSPTSAAVAATLRSTSRWRSCCATWAPITGCCRGSPGAATSASSARPASTCRVGTLMRTPARRVRRLPHLGRQPGPDSTRVARRRGRSMPAGGRRAREQPSLHQPEPLRRAAARPPRALPLPPAARWPRPTTSGRCSGS